MQARIERLAAENHDPDLAPVLRELIKGFHQEQATHEFRVAMFYLTKRAKYAAAANRLAFIRERYPDYVRSDDVLYFLGICSLRLGRLEQAWEAMNELVQHYQTSPRAAGARQQLVTLAHYKPVPPRPMPN
jgi:outer membrane protein assembly factor BamD (BamD/ComL family)